MYYNFIKNIKDFKHYTLDESNYLLEASLDKVSPYSKKDVVFSLTRLHSVFDSMVYSLTLLRYNTPDCITKASNITRAVINAQEKDTSSPHCGLWLYDLESDMYAYGFPEKNLTSAIGIPLFIQYKEFSHLFSDDLLTDIKAALIRACYAIIHRNVDMQDSHIVIAETFLTAVCGYYFDIPELSYYSSNKLEAFYFYNISHGNFYLFNDSYHYFYCLTIFHFQKRYLKNPSVDYIIDNITNEIWQILSTHYNAHLSSFTAPSMCMIKKFFDKELIDHLKTVCTNSSPKDSIFSLKGLCPVEFRGYFTGAKQPDYYQKLVYSGCTYPFYAYPQIATTLIQPNYDIGSFCRCQCWKEHSPFLAHFGTEASPYAITISVLHNGFEFTSAQLSIVQYFNYALGHITLATDRGIRHICHDFSDGVINTSDLRVRFEITGDVSKLDISQIDSILKVSCDDVNFIFNYSYFVYDNKPVPSELTIGDDSVCFDLIMYKGKSKEIILEQLKETIISWAFCISDDKIADLEVCNEIKNNKLVSTMITNNGIELYLESLHSPSTFVNIHSNNVQKIADIPSEKFVLNNNINNKQLSFLTHSNNANSIYEFLINPKDDINQCLQSLSQYPEEEFVVAARHIFSLLIKNNISLNITKRIAIQMLIQIYDYYKNINFQFEAIISSQTQMTQLYISFSTDINEVEKHTVSALKLLHTHYIKSHKTTANSLILTKIISLINENFSDPQLSLEYISKELGVSTFSVSKIFQQKLKMKYIDYVTNIRIDYAKQLLEQTNLPLTEISSKAGYTEQSTFFRAFKKITKETPGQYRRIVKR